MIYATQQRAEEVAAELNRQPGYAPAKAVLTADGWTVIRSYRHAKPQPTAEQIEALHRFAAANGRRWKSELSTVWMNGAYNYAVLGGADPGLLQQIRNTFGPSWLVRFRLKAATFPPSCRACGNIEGLCICLAPQEVK
jgi:hypothetical protein